MSDYFEKRKGWLETAVTTHGELKVVQPVHLLDELFPRQPRLSGWPIWIDSRGLGPGRQPYAIRTGWEALVVLESPQFVAVPMIDFWRLEANGRFYHRRTYQDDVTSRLIEAQRGKLIDFPIAIQRVTEAVATAAAFSSHLVLKPDDSSITVVTRWSNLKGRTLASWSQPGRDLFNTYIAYDDEMVAEVEIPLSVARSALGPYVESLLRPLFTIFGAPISSSVIQEIATATLKGMVH